MQLRDLIKPEQRALLEALRAAKPTGSNRETPPPKAALGRAAWKSAPNQPQVPLHPKIQVQSRNPTNSAPKRVLTSKDIK